MPVDHILLTELQQEQPITHMMATTGLKSETVRTRLFRFRTRARKILAEHPQRHLISNL